MAASPISDALQIALVLVVLAAAWTDIRTRRIPNWITGAGAVLGLVAHAFNSGLPGAWTSLAGLLLGCGIFLPFFLWGRMGAGDVKLFGVVGAITGPSALVLVFVFTALLGGVIAAAAALWQRQWQVTIPYGVAIAGGALMFLIL
jgi:prepilin peptidase CpaA